MSDAVKFALGATNGQMESIVWEGSMSTMRKRNNPYVGRVRKVCKGINLQFGVSYENKVNNEREREGLERDFIPQSPRGMEWEVYPKVLRSIKDSEKKYIRVTTTAKTRIEVIYLVDDRIATSEETAEILSYIPKSEASSVFNLAEESIIRWKVGGREYENKSRVNNLMEYSVRV